MKIKPSYDIRECVPSPKESQVPGAASRGVVAEEKVIGV